MIRNAKLPFGVKLSGKIRTNDQNRLYFKWVDIMADYFGNTSAAMHEALKLEILGPEFVNIGGKIVSVPPQSKNKDIKDFGDYMNRVAAFAADYDIILPHEIDSGIPTKRT